MKEEELTRTERLKSTTIYKILLQLYLLKPWLDYDGKKLYLIAFLVIFIYFVNKKKFQIYLLIVINIDLNINKYKKGFTSFMNIFI